MNKIKEYLNEVEHKEIQKFIENKTLFEAVRKVLMESVYRHGTLREGEPANAMLNYAFFLAARRRRDHLTNEQLGEDLSAIWEGANLVEAGFKELERFKEINEPNKQKNNPGR